MLDKVKTITRFGTTGISLTKYLGVGIKDIRFTLEDTQEDNAIPRIVEIILEDDTVLDVICYSDKPALSKAYHWDGENWADVSPEKFNNLTLKLLGFEQLRN